MSLTLPIFFVFFLISLGSLGAVIIQARDCLRLLGTAQRKIGVRKMAILFGLSLLLMIASLVAIRVFWANPGFT
ncbi:MAG: hypothetical protein ACE5DX_05770, partial [Candidatus Dojkabacteria bacterium]